MPSSNHRLSLLALVFSLSAASVAAQVTTRVSVSSSGIPARNYSGVCAMSATGNSVAFSSLSSNLVAGDTNGRFDIFVHDRTSGETVRVSVASDGTEADADCMGPYLSADGRVAAYRTSATTLVPGDTNGVADVFVRDLVLGITERISVATDGTQADGDSFYGVVSASGRFVAFNSLATNLVSNDTNGDYDIFVRDRFTRTTEVISVDANGNVGQWYSVEPSLSYDGRYVAFASANDLLPGDTNGMLDVYVRDRFLGILALASVATGGAQADAPCFVPALTADGRYVVFTSLATTLAPDANTVPDVFVRDLVAGTTERVSVALGGGEVDGGSQNYYSHACISADGRYVVFESTATNLVPNDTNGTGDVFRVDRTTGAIERLSEGALGEGNALSMRPTLSSTGEQIAFESWADNLIAGDGDVSFDVFVRDYTIACPPITAYCTPKTNSLGCEPLITSSGLPSLTFAAFWISAIDVVPNKPGRLVWALAPDVLPFTGGTVCVGGPRIALPAQPALDIASPTACSGAHAFELDGAYWQAHAVPAGTTIYAQVVSRDPGSLGALGLTAGLTFTVCP